MGLSLSLPQQIEREHWAPICVKDDVASRSLRRLSAVLPGMLGGDDDDAEIAEPPLFQAQTLYIEEWVKELPDPKDIKDYMIDLYADDDDESKRAMSIDPRKMSEMRKPSAALGGHGAVFLTAYRLQMFAQSHYPWSEITCRKWGSTSVQVSVAGASAQPSASTAAAAQSPSNSEYKRAQSLGFITDKDNEWMYNLDHLETEHQKR
eukprot:PhM_4_TR13560/c0_g1_i1/m.38680